MTATATAPRPQLTLPGQVHAAAGPHDLSGMFVAHHAFRRDLGRFAAAARNTPVDDVATWSALAERWARFGEVLHHHHTTEDTAIWPPLLDRVDEAGDAGARVTLEEMEAEHEVIDPMLAACAAGFAAMAQDPGTGAKDELADLVVATRDSLARHLAHEEGEALPLLQRHMTADAWAAAERIAGSGMSIRKLGFLVPWAADGLGMDVLQRAFGTSPVLRVVLKLTRGRYLQNEAVAFRHI
jgi:hemerythrin-like domain-containing protein